MAKKKKPAAAATDREMDKLRKFLVLRPGRPSPFYCEENEWGIFTFENPNYEAEVTEFLIRQGRADLIPEGFNPKRQKRKRANSRQAK